MMANNFSPSVDPEAEENLSPSTNSASYEETVHDLQCPKAVCDELQNRHLQAENPFANSFEAWKGDVLTYERLISRDYLSEAEADQLELILDKAQYDNRLSFWLTRADEIVLEKKKGLLSNEHVSGYQESQKFLRKSLKAQNLNCDNDCCLDD